MTQDLQNRAKDIRLLIMDVDGTLTDGAKFFSARGEELKRFHTRDGMGITLAHKAGLHTAIITSEDSPIVSARAAQLDIPNVILGCRDKTTALGELLERLGMSHNEVAYIGDDINDLHAMRLCGLSACPADSVTVIRENVNVICNATGGNGAVREFVELILTARHLPITLPEQW